MALKPFDLGDTQQHLHTGDNMGQVTVWAAMDEGNGLIYSHVECYMQNEHGFGSVKINLDCAQLEKLAGDCMRIMAYRHELEARLKKAAPGDGAATGEDAGKGAA